MVAEEKRALPEQAQDARPRTSTAPPSGAGEEVPERAETPAAAADDDRRESQRVRIELLIRDVALGGSFEPFRGNLALGGVWFDALHPPVGSRVEVRFLVPGGRQEIRAVGEVLRISRDGARFGAHVKFVEIPLEAELAIARYLQGG